MSQQNLYIALLGGKHQNANIEVHDIIPFISTNLQLAFPYLKAQWFGLKQGVHLDAWMKINGVSYLGKKYQVQIHEQAQAHAALKLFFINLGAYIANEFGEVHKYLVVAATDKADAKIQGKLAIENNWLQPHTDAIVDVDDCLELDMFNQKYIHLVEGDFQPNSFENDYIIL